MKYEVFGRVRTFSAIRAGIYAHIDGSVHLKTWRPIRGDSRRWVASYSGGGIYIDEEGTTATAALRALQERVEHVVTCASAHLKGEHP
jgi:hypothetical protein